MKHVSLGLLFLSAVALQLGCAGNRIEPIANRSIDPPSQLRDLYQAAAKQPEVLTVSLARAECVPNGVAIWLSMSGRGVTEVVQRNQVTLSQAIADQVGTSGTLEVLDENGQAVEWESAVLPERMSPEFSDAARSRPLLSSPPIAYPGDFEQEPLPTSISGVYSQVLYIAVPNARPGFVVRFAEDQGRLGPRALVEGRLRWVQNTYGRFDRFEVIRNSVVVEPRTP